MKGQLKGDTQKKSGKLVQPLQRTYTQFPDIEGEDDEIHTTTSELNVRVAHSAKMNYEKQRQLWYKERAVAKTTYHPKS